MFKDSRNSKQKKRPKTKNRKGRFIVRSSNNKKKRDFSGRPKHSRLLKPKKQVNKQKKGVGRGDVKRLILHSNKKVISLMERIAHFKQSSTSTTRTDRQRSSSRRKRKDPEARAAQREAQRNKILRALGVSLQNTKMFLTMITEEDELNSLIIYVNNLSSCCTSIGAVEKALKIIDWVFETIEFPCPYPKCVLLYSKALAYYSSSNFDKATEALRELFRGASEELRTLVRKNEVDFNFLPKEVIMKEVSSVRSYCRVYLKGKLLKFSMLKKVLGVIEDPLLRSEAAESTVLEIAHTLKLLKRCNFKCSEGANKLQRLKAYFSVKIQRNANNEDEDRETPLVDATTPGGGSSGQVQTASIRGIMQNDERDGYFINKKLELNHIHKIRLSNRSVKKKKPSKSRAYMYNSRELTRVKSGFFRFQSNSPKNKSLEQSRNLNSPKNSKTSLEISMRDKFEYERRSNKGEVLGHSIFSKQRM